MSATLSRFAAIDDIAEVSSTLDTFFDERESRASELGGPYRRLWESARLASAGGKKIRPALVIGTYRALDGTDIDSAVQVAAAFELLHTAFLLHDDVIDHDLVRRGRPNLAGARAIEAVDLGVSDTDAERWGQASAILAGDLLIHAAQGMIAALPGVTARRTALLELLERCIFQTAAGELADVAFSTRVEPAGLEEALAMTENKTSAYTFEAPLAAGAVLGNAEPDVVAALQEFGRAIGIAFQLRDDLLGVFGFEESTGKSVLSDLRGRKVTPLIAYARTTSVGDELERAIENAAYDAGSSDENGAAFEVRRLLIESGARDYVEELIQNYARHAIRVIDTAQVPVRLRSPLRQVVLEATERTA